MSGKDHPRLSIAMVVRNAAEPLAETLDSVRKIADEIILVDTGSTDHTRDVAAEYPTKFFSVAWTDSFSAARNHAAQLCVGDWILWLDAGERLSPEAAQGLRDFVDSQAQPGTAYMLVVRVPAQTGEIAGEQIGAIRLVPNDPALKFVGRVRESLTRSLSAAGITVEGLPFRIDRGTRELDPQVKSRRAKRNIQLAELELREQGPQPALLNCLGDAFHALGQDERAAHYYRQAISVAAPESSDMLAGYYGLVMALQSSDQGRTGQLNACAAALQVFPLDAQLLCASGGYLQSLGQLEMATKAYETAFRFGQVNPEVWHLDGIIEVAVSCYCQALQLQQKFDAAQQTLEAQLQNYPDSQRLRRQLLSLYVQQGNRKGALAQLEQLPPETPYREALETAVRGACLASSRNWCQAVAYLEAAYRQGSRDVICLQWYAVALLSTGEVQKALPILAQWRSIDPHHPELTRLLTLAASSMGPSDRQLRADATALAPAITHFPMLSATAVAQDS